MKKYLFSSILIFLVILVVAIRLYNNPLINNNLFVVVAIVLVGILLSVLIRKFFLGPVQLPSPVAPSNTNLTDEQKKFIDSWAMGGFLGPWYLILNNATKSAPWSILIPFQLARKGRRIVWDTGVWQEFESYRKRQLLLDKIALFLSVAPLFIFLIFIIYISWN